MSDSGKTRGPVDVSLLLKAGQDLVEVMREMLAQLPPPTIEQALKGDRSPLYQACLVRQIEGYHAITTLVASNLGHMAPAFLRPACEEFFWIKYLNKVPAEAFKELFLAITAAENLRGLTAQQMYIGKRGMKSLGFSTQFVNKAISDYRAINEKIRRIGEGLGWPTNVEAGGQSAVPTTHWVANQVGEGKLYDYLYSATSRHVHFSMGELLRRPETMDGGALDFTAERKRNFRSHFAIHWASTFLLRTAAECLAGTGEEFTLPEGTEARMFDIAQRLGQYGIPAVTYPREWRS
jgi:hypothetical protein